MGRITQRSMRGVNEKRDARVCECSRKSINAPGDRRGRTSIWEHGEHEMEGHPGGCPGNLPILNKGALFA